ncbi:Ig-like domain-containing protein [Ramlibacter sp.]|uniref:Ig-like domain-containing protein n=1 Tax=Ramlibacter sp. TaxID=1917967 RepID=UPI002B72E951|nr:Ig-like domain-containing protein [Ramlibacter sp.]HWI80728.1 Ig-like domain-containing protein [Ramlibacter sp.]
MSTIAGARSGAAASALREQRVNTTTSGDQVTPSITGLSDGGYVVTWASADESGSGVYGQRFDGQGVAVGSQTRINTNTADDQSMPAVTALNAGGYVVTWQSAVAGASVSDIFMQRFDATGAPAGSQALVNATTADSQQLAKVAALHDGGYAVAWVTVNPLLEGGRDILVQRFDGTGNAVGTETLVSTLSSFGAVDAVAGLKDGGYLVAWSFSGGGGWYGGGTGFQLQRFDSAGVAVGGPVGVEFFHLNDPFAPDVAGLSDGGYVLTWQALGYLGSGNAETASSTGIYAQRFDSAGARIGGEVLVNSTTAGSQTQPVVTALADGGWVVAWESDGQDGSGLGIYTQRFDGSGTRVGGETLANTTTAGSQSQPTISALEDGGYVLAWVSAGQDGSGAGIYTQSFDASGLPEVPGDSVAPVAVDFFPAPGSHTLPPDWSPGITFSEAVQAGAGTITLQTAAGQLVQTFHVATDPGIQFFGDRILIDPAADLQPGTSYRLIVGPDAIEDLAGNAYAGESGYSFTTAGAPPPSGDTTAPRAVDFFPAPGSHTLPPDWSPGITFSEAVQAGAGTITLQTAAGQLVQAFHVATDPGVQFFGDRILIDPAADLQPGTSYRLIVGPDAIEDLAGNAYAGESDYGFTTAGAPPPSGDTAAPRAVDFFPAPGSHTLPPDWSPGITFSEAVQAGAGTITLQTAAGQLVQTFHVGTDPGIQFFGDRILIDPAADLQPGTTYRLIVGPDAIEDLAGNAYAGESDYSFTAATGVEATLVGVGSQGVLAL